MTDSFIDCVGIVCLRPDMDKVLLIRRGKPPRAGQWSIPGGRIEASETELEACLRELYEETGVTAQIIGKIETIDAMFEGYKYRLHDYLAIYADGDVRAGDDAVHAEFMTYDDADGLGMWSETMRIINKARTMLTAYENTNSL